MSVQISKYILIIVGCICINVNLNARHIIGGDVFYDCLGIDTIANTVSLHFEFQMYRDNRDPNGADFDGGPGSNNPGAEFGIYRRAGSSWVFVEKTRPLVYVLREKVEPNTQPCLITPPGIDVERAIYEFDVELDIIDQDYMVVFQRCCRSESISNLVDPGQFGAAFAIEMTPEALRTCNNSPRFNEFPPLIICGGFPLEYDHSASDIEGDQLTYGFCVPLSAGGFNGNVNVPRTDCLNTPTPEPSVCTPDAFRPVSFRAPSFTSTAPMGGSPVVSVDRNTGLISGTPEIIGEHVMAVCATETRDGVRLSTIRRDFQFIVSSCEKAVDAIIASDRTIGESQFELVLCGDLDVQFENRSVRRQDIKEYLWEYQIGDELFTSDEKDPVITFPETGVYDLKMTINPDVTNCTDSAEITVFLYPGLEAGFEYAFDTCIAGPVDFTDLSYTDGDFIVSRTWDYGDGVVENRLNPSHIYQTPGSRNVSLTIQDNNGCVDEIQQLVTYAPAPNVIIVEPSTFVGCEPAEVFFDNLTFPIDETYDITWDFGDGTMGDEIKEISPTHIYEEDGIYSISIDIISPFGCIASRTYPNWIRVQKGPEADFTFSPDEPNLNENVVSFQNLTQGAINYFWDFGGESISFERNPTHAFQDTGLYDVVLLATSENGCTDIATQVIDIIPLAQLFYPNAFTPNGDGRNDVFFGVGASNLINDYTLRIFDRWGKQVFYSEDPTEGWNGRLNNTGEFLPVGVYTYLSTYRIPRGERREERGFATIVR